MMADKVWVYIDQYQGEAIPAAWEVISAARLLTEQLGGGVTAVVAGSAVQQVAEEAVQYGADLVYVCENDTLDEFRAEPFASLLSNPRFYTCHKLGYFQKIVPTLWTASETSFIS